MRASALLLLWLWLLWGALIRRAIFVQSSTWCVVWIHTVKFKTKF